MSPAKKNLFLARALSHNVSDVILEIEILAVASQRSPSELPSRLLCLVTRTAV